MISRGRFVLILHQWIRALLKDLLSNILSQVSTSIMVRICLCSLMNNTINPFPGTHSGKVTWPFQCKDLTRHGPLQIMLHQLDFRPPTTQKSCTAMLEIVAKLLLAPIAVGTLGGTRDKSIVRVRPTCAKMIHVQRSLNGRMHDLSTTGETILTWQLICH